MLVASVEKILEDMKTNPKGVRFNELKRVCEQYFGPPRQNSTSHCVYRMPWHGDPRVNIQGKKGMAKAYQVRQVLLAIDRLEMKDGT